MLSKTSLAEALKNIEDCNENLSNSLKKEKLQKMAQSPYYFFRGTNHLFWEYFSNDNRLNFFSNNNSNTWIQGDLHAYNYGIYGDENNNLIYGLNDFDESCIADYKFDLWRMACSIVLIWRENECDNQDKLNNILSCFSNSYIDTFNNYLKDGESALQKVTESNAFGKLDNIIKETAQKDSRKKMLQRWTTNEESDLKFDLSYEKLADLSNEKRKEIEKNFAEYVKRIKQKFDFRDDYFEIIDIAHRISSGTGSYGTPRYYILIKGDSSDKFGQVILDVKLQTKPSAYIFLDKIFKNEYDQRFENEGIRHKEAYKALNYYIDKHLSWIELSQGVFSVRERSPYKSYFPTKLLNSEKRFAKLATQWGNILACAHIKSYDNFDVNGICKLINNNTTDFIGLVRSVAIEFANYNDEVYKEFAKLHKN